MLGVRGGWKAQNCLPLTRSIPEVAVVLPSRGSGAPIAIHFSKSAIVVVGSLPLGGICKSPSYFNAFRSVP